MFLKSSLFTYQNTKFLKTKDTEYFIIGLPLSPAKLGDGKFNVCKFSTPGCRQICVSFAGNNKLTSVQESHRRKTLMYINDRKNFLEQLDAELYYYNKLCKSFDKKLVCRMNTYSDLDWSKELINGKSLFELHENQFYDYTKNFNKVSTNSNYHLTYSYDQVNHNKAMKVLERGDNLAVVFEKELPKTFMNYPVIDSNSSDLRFLDPKNVVCGLTFKNMTHLGAVNSEIKLHNTLVVKKDNKFNKVHIDMEW